MPYYILPTLHEVHFSLQWFDFFSDMPYLEEGHALHSTFKDCILVFAVGDTESVNRPPLTDIWLFLEL